MFELHLKFETRLKFFKFGLWTQYFSYKYESKFLDWIIIMGRYYSFYGFIINNKKQG